MLSFSGSLKVCVAVEPCDMRKGFNGLFAAVTERLGEDPKGGALYVFCNRRRNRLKILYFDGTGLWVLTKRLVAHCPLYLFWETAVSVSSAFQCQRDGFGNHWRTVRHAGGAIARRLAARYPKLDVR
jgi:hypothetical protein